MSAMSPAACGFSSAPRVVLDWHGGHDQRVGGGIASDVDLMKLAPGASIT
jgi:hypothetical protein